MALKSVGTPSRMASRGFGMAAAPSGMASDTFGDGSRQLREWVPTPLGMAAAPLRMASRAFGMAIRPLGMTAMSFPDDIAVL